jgi:A/G-specific adenine glycosylase
VLARAFVGDDEMPSREFQALADGFVPAGRAATWTHALMDVGAAFCRARDPRCAACPLRPSCAYAAGIDGSSTTGSAPARRARGQSTQRFESTTRWLRGRILDRLRDASDGRWVTFDGPIGEHDVEAVIEALGDLHRDGMLELDDSGHLARLTFGPPASNEMRGCPA